MIHKCVVLLLKPIQLEKNDTQNCGTRIKTNTTGKKKKKKSNLCVVLVLKPIQLAKNDRQICGNVLKPIHLAKNNRPNRKETMTYELR